MYKEFFKGEHMDIYHQVEQIFEVPNMNQTGLYVKFCPVDYDWYKIIKIKEYPPGSAIKFVLVRSEVQTSMFNVYGTHEEFNPYNLVMHYSPLKLIDAKIIFPEMNFTEENYGFTKMYVPPGFTGSVSYECQQ